jgi:hypothetical protein
MKNVVWEVPVLAYQVMFAKELTESRLYQVLAPFFPATFVNTVPVA